MSVLLTNSYQAIASGTKSFTANEISCGVKQTIYARYELIDSEAQSAILNVKTVVEGTKNSFTSSGNTQTIVLDGTKKTKSYTIGTISNGTKKETFETSFTVAYDEDGTWSNKDISASTDVYLNYVVQAAGQISLPAIATSNVYLGVDGEVKKTHAYVGVDGVATKCEVYVGVDGTPVKCA